MSKLLKTALMTAFAASCIAGASFAFAGGHNGGGHHSKDNKCAADNLTTNPQDSNADCMR